MTQRRQTGNAGESRAAAFLERRGFVIVARNWSCRYGELDIVAERGETIVFVEVRVRKDALDSARASIGARKIARLTATAVCYLQEHRCEDRDWRIDVVTISGDHIEHIPHAIEDAD